MDEGDSKFPIKITNFINPHVFHFKLENIVGQADEEIENALAEEAKQMQWRYSTGYQPKLNEIVSVHVLEWSKWVRGQIDLILDEYNCKQYVVWCLDQGVPVKLGAQYILPLSVGLQRLPAMTYVGGLAKCVPTGKRLNIAKMKHETQTADEFSEFVITSARQLIEEAAEIYFIPRQRMGDHIFGDIKLTFYKGITLDLMTEMALREGVKSDDFFIPKDIEQWQTIAKNRYENHLGNLNVRSTAKLMSYVRISERKQSSKISVCSHDLDDEDRMVLDWSRNNEKLAAELKRDLLRRFAQTVNSLDVYVQPERVEKDSRWNKNNLGSLGSMNLSVLSLGPQRFDSRSTLTQVQSMAHFEKPEKPRAINRLTERLRAASISSNHSSSSNAKPENKKIAFVPSGYERDILEFHKYNHI